MSASKTPAMLAALDGHVVVVARKADGSTEAYVTRDQRFIGRFGDDEPAALLPFRGVRDVLLDALTRLESS